MGSIRNESPYPSKSLLNQRCLHHHGDTPLLASPAKLQSILWSTGAHREDTWEEYWTKMIFFLSYLHLSAIRENSVIFLTLSTVGTTSENQTLEAFVDIHIQINNCKDVMFLCNQWKSNHLFHFGLWDKSQNTKPWYVENYNSHFSILSDILEANH